MRLFPALASLCLLSVRTAVGQSATSSTEATQLAAIEHRVERAFVDTDTLLLEGVCAPEFRFKHASGNIQDRASWLSDVRASRGKYQARDLDSLDVELHDDVALATRRIHVRSRTADGALDEYTIRHVRVYAFRAGHWQLLTHHTSQLTRGPLASP